MERRTMLAGTLGLGSLPVAVGTYRQLNEEQEDHSCSEPELENPRTYQVRSIDQLEQHHGSGGYIISSEEDVRELGLPSGVDVDFEVEFGILCIIQGHGNPTNPQLLGVNQDGPDRLTVYACWEQRSYDDDNKLWYRVLTVSHDGNIPEEATLEAESVGPTR